MPEGFHVTRCPLDYTEGMVFGLQPLKRTGLYRMYSDNGTTNASIHLTNFDAAAPIYPRGLSPHGLRYLLFPPANGNLAIERELEQCRRENHQNQPSRYESYFAWPCEKSARAWMADQTQLGHACSLLRVEAETAIPRQQELVNHYQQIRAKGVEACDLYWHTTATNGRIELQMPGPITITEVIEQAPVPGEP